MELTLHYSDKDIKDAIIDELVGVWENITCSGSKFDVEDDQEFWLIRPNTDDILTKGLSISWKHIHEAYTCSFKEDIYPEWMNKESNQHKLLAYFKYLKS